MKKVFAVALAALAVGACTTTPFSSLKQSYRSVADQNGNTVGSIFIWSNDVNAAVIYKTGVVCAQRAMTAVTSDSRLKAAVPDSILKLSQAAASAAAAAATSAVSVDGDADPAGAQAVAAQATAQSSALIELAASIQEAAQLLTTTTERTAFLAVGLFYLCQLSNNGSIGTNDASQLIALLIREAGRLEAGGKTEPLAPTAVRAPTPVVPSTPAPSAGPRALPGGQS